MLWLMTHVLPHMPSATRADAAADSFVFMALDPSLDGSAGSYPAKSTNRVQAPSPTTSAKRNASGSWRASSPAWTRPEHNAFWISVYRLRTGPPRGTTAGKRPERPDHLLRRQDHRRLKATTASPMKFRTPPANLGHRQRRSRRSQFHAAPGSGLTHPPDPARTAWPGRCRQARDTRHRRLSISREGLRGGARWQRAFPGPPLSVSGLGGGSGRAGRCRVRVPGRAGRPRGRWSRRSGRGRPVTAAGRSRDISGKGGCDAPLARSPGPCGRPTARNRRPDGRRRQ